MEMDKPKDALAREQSRFRREDETAVILEVVEEEGDEDDGNVEEISS